MCRINACMYVQSTICAYTVGTAPCLINYPWPRLGVIEPCMPASSPALFSRCQRMQAVSQRKIVGPSSIPVGRQYVEERGMATTMFSGCHMPETPTALTKRCQRFATDRYLDKNWRSKKSSIVAWDARMLPVCNCKLFSSNKAECHA